MEPKKAKLIETENKGKVARGRGWDVGERYKLPVIRWMSSGHLRCSKVIIVNNYILEIC